MNGDPDWRDLAASLPNSSPQFTLNPERTALLVVDMQNACAHEHRGVGAYLKQNHPQVAEHYFGQLRRHVVSNIKRLLGDFRQHGLKVVYLTFGPHLPDLSDMGGRKETEVRIRRTAGTEHNLFAVGSAEHAIRDDLAPQTGELVINKVTRGAFNSTGLDQLLRNMSIDYLAICGVVTHGCVESTARDASDRGYKCILISDASAGFSALLDNATMASFASIFGRVLTTDETISELGAQYLVNKSEVLRS